MSRAPGALRVDEAIGRIVASIKRGRTAFFLGAGASCDAPSSLPTSIALLEELSSRIALASPGSPRATTAGRITAGVRFELFIQAVAAAIGPRTVEALAVLDGGHPNHNHELVAELAERGLSQLVLTTNFDSLLEAALRRRGVAFCLRSRNRDYRAKTRKTTAFEVVKLHGSLRDDDGEPSPSTIIVAANQVGKSLPRAKARMLKKVLRSYDLVFVGYSGLDDFDLLPLLLTTPSDRELFWVDHKPGRSIACLDSSAYAKHRTEDLSPGERIVASRANALLIRGLTSSVTRRLSRELFGRLPARVQSRRPAQTFGYLDEWEQRVDLSHHKALINGLLLKHLEDYKAAVRMLDLVDSRSRNAGQARFNAAVCCRRSNQIDEARKRLRALVTKRRRFGMQPEALVELGLLESEQGQQRVAQRYLNKALSLTRRRPAVRVAAHNNLGMSFLFDAEKREIENDVSGAKDAAKKSVFHLQTAKRAVGGVGNPHVTANVLGNLGLALGLLGRWRRAEVCFAEALRLFQSLGLTTEEASCLGNTGYHYRKRALAVGPHSPEYRELLTRALLFNRKAHALKKRLSVPRRIAFSQHELGEVYRLLGQRKRALHWLESAKEILQREGLVGYTRAVQEAIDLIASQPARGSK